MQYFNKNRHGSRPDGVESKNFRITTLDEAFNNVNSMNPNYVKIKNGNQTDRGYYTQKAHAQGIVEQGEAQEFSKRSSRGYATSQGFADILSNGTRSKETEMDPTKLSPSMRAGAKLEVRRTNEEGI